MSTRARARARVSRGPALARGDACATTSAARCSGSRLCKCAPSNGPPSAWKYHHGTPLIIELTRAVAKVLEDSGKMAADTDVRQFVEWARQAAAQAAQKRYSEAGYGGIVVYVPPFDRRNPVITLAVLEGRVAQVRVAGQQAATARHPAEQVQRQRHQRARGLKHDGIQPGRAIAG